MNSGSFKNFKSNYGFTLAEVLITLVIMGVIAALTVPTLMKNTQKQELVTALKKADSTLSAALIDMARNNDSSPGDYSFVNDSNFLNELAKVVNVIKKCNSSAKCFPMNVMSYTGVGPTTDAVGDGASAVLADGQILTFKQSYGTSLGISAEDIANCRGRIFVDVNGHKGPNLIGRDGFYFYVVNGKGLVPAGSADDNYSYCNPSTTTGGCAARVLRENAMNY